MAKLNVHDIRKRAKAIIFENPGGIRSGDLVERISTESSDTPRGTIQTQVSSLDKTMPTDITKPSRGLYKPLTLGGDESVVVGDTEQVASTGVKILEGEFYEPFAQWLKNDLVS